jgi:hypothetical protein
MLNWYWALVASSCVRLLVHLDVFCEAYGGFYVRTHVTTCACAHIRERMPAAQSFQADRLAVFDGYLGPSPSLKGSLHQSLLCEDVPYLLFCQF